MFRSTPRGLVFAGLLLALVAASCGGAYSGPAVTLSSQVDMRAADSARCGDLVISVNHQINALNVDSDAVRIPTSDPIRRVGFSPGCSTVFVESYADSDMRQLAVVNLSTNAKGDSSAPDGAVIGNSGGTIFLDAFSSRAGTAWVTVWQDPATRMWSVSGAALETEFGERVSGNVSGLAARPDDFNLHIDDDGQPTHWLIAFPTGDPIVMPLDSAE